MFVYRVGGRLLTTYQLSNLPHASQDDRSRLQCVGWIIIDTRQRYQLHSGFAQSDTALNLAQYAINTMFNP